MMCKYPIIRKSGVAQKHVVLSEDARLLATPLPCGQCLHCRINRARVWTFRLMLEQQTSIDSAFVTLTYSDEQIPEGGTLVKSDLQNFLKRYRKRVEPSKIRYYGVGEYGTNTYRPHYHLAIFANTDLCRPALADAWQKGYIMAGDLTRDSARYMSGYIVKGLTKQNEALGDRLAEFATMSKQKGGIGSGRIEEIARQANESRHNFRQILRRVTSGNQKFPLGRYLTQRLADKMGFGQTEKSLELWEYQREIFDKHLEQDEHYYSSFFQAKAGPRLSQEKRHKIYNQRRNI